MLKLILFLIAIKVSSIRSNCPDGQYSCSNSTDCVPVAKICDESNNCTYGSREKIRCINCSFNASDQQHCLKEVNGSRIIVCRSANETSGQHENCAEKESQTTTKGSPLALTGNVYNSSNYKTCENQFNGFYCASASKYIDSICISMDHVCDHIKDCPFGEDESECNKNCEQTASSSLNKNLKCIQHPHSGQLIRCINESLQISSKSNPTCHSIDKCSRLTAQFCSFNCENIGNNYKCICPDGYEVHNETEFCNQAMKDSYKPNLFAVTDQKVLFYDIQKRMAQSLASLNIHDSLDYLEYDSNEEFIIYYDHGKQSIMCQSQKESLGIVIIPNVTVHQFTYESIHKSLYVLNKENRSLDFYNPISCRKDSKIYKHSWFLNFSVQSIKMLAVDLDLGQLISTTDQSVLLATLTKIQSFVTVYNATQTISRSFYDPVFKRLFWTSPSTERGKHSVHTCGHNFTRCYNTMILVTDTGPLTFLNENLIHPNELPYRLQSTTVYGTDRFQSNFLGSAAGDFRILRPIYYSNVQENKSTCLVEKSDSPAKYFCFPVKKNVFINITIDGQSGTPFPMKKKSKKNLWLVVILFPTGMVIFLISVFFAMNYFHPSFKDIFVARLRNDPQTERLTVDEPTFEEFNINSETNNDRSPLTNQLNY